MNILVIWLGIPEKIDFYLLENLDSETANKILAANNKYVGTVKSHENANWLSEYLVGKSKVNTPFDAPPCKVIVSGYIM